MNDLEQYLNSKGPVGSLGRLEAIAILGLGERSLSAQRAVYNRHRRRELMSMGLTYDQSILILNDEYKKAEVKEN